MKRQMEKNHDALKEYRNKILEKQDNRVNPFNPFSNGESYKLIHRRVENYELLIAFVTVNRKKTTLSKKSVMMVSEMLDPAINGIAFIDAKMYHWKAKHGLVTDIDEIVAVHQNFPVLDVAIQHALLSKDCKTLAVIRATAIPHVQCCAVYKDTGIDKAQFKYAGSAMNLVDTTYAAISQTGLYIAFGDRYEMCIMHNAKIKKFKTRKPEPLCRVAGVDIIECQESTGISGYCIAVKHDNKVFIQKTMNDQIVFENTLFMGMGKEDIRSVAFIPDSTQIILVAAESVKIVIADWSKAECWVKTLNFNWMVCTNPLNTMIGVKDATCLFDCDSLYVRYLMMCNRSSLFDSGFSESLEAIVVDYKNETAKHYFNPPMPPMQLTASSAKSLNLFTNNSTLEARKSIRFGGFLFSCVAKANPWSSFRHLNITEVFTENIVDIVCCSEHILLATTQLFFESF